jgi:tetratricopeptide (TPR) repeat protein
LFRLLGLHPGPDFTVAAAAALAGIEAEEAGPVLGQLAEAHLVSEDAASRFGMHDLLRLFARGTCQDTDDEADREAAAGRLVGYYLDLARFLDSCVDPELRLAAARAAEQDGVPLPSIREAFAMFGAERLCLLAAVGLAAQQGWDEQVWQLSVSMADSLRILRYLDDLLTVMEAGLAAARHVGDTRAEGDALGNLGIAYRALQRFEEAIGCYQQSLTIFREADDRRTEGMALSSLGIAYAELQRFEEAIGCFQQSLAICREVGDPLGEGQALGNLGIAYRALRRFEEAITCQQQSLTIFRETGDRRGEGMLLGNLGIAYAELRRFEEAIDCSQQSLAICREVGDRYGEGNALDDLGAAYQEIGQRDRAAMCWREAAAAMRDAGDHEKAELLDQLAASAQARRRRWWRRGGRSAGI